MGAPTNASPLSGVRSIRKVRISGFSAFMSDILSGASSTNACSLPVAARPQLQQAGHPGLLIRVMYSLASRPLLQWEIITSSKSGTIPESRTFRLWSIWLMEYDSKTSLCVFLAAFKKAAYQNRDMRQNQEALPCLILCRVSFQTDLRLAIHRTTVYQKACGQSREIEQAFCAFLHYTKSVVWDEIFLLVSLILFCFGHSLHLYVGKALIKKKLLVFFWTFKK